MARAGNVCECGCGHRGPLDLDHYFGGSKKRSMESVETCWALTGACHSQKSDNYPSAAVWAERFAAHCKRHNYAVPAFPKKARTA